MIAMTIADLAGWKPEIHFAKPSNAAGKVWSINYPGRYLPLTEAGVAWAEKLMAERPYFRDAWTIERTQ